MNDSDRLINKILDMINLQQFSENDELLLLENVGSEDSEVRTLVAESLSNYSDKRALNALSELAHDECPNVRAESAMSLAAFAAEASFDILIKLADDADVTVSGTAIRSMALVAGKSKFRQAAVYKIKAIHDRASDEWLQFMCITSLYTLGVDCKSKVLKGLTSSDYHIRDIAVNLISENIHDFCRVSELKTTLFDAVFIETVEWLKDKMVELINKIDGISVDT